MNEQEMQFMNEMKMRMQEEQFRQVNQQNLINQNSAFASTQDKNLIQYQLEMDNILERIDHMLRGDELKFVNNGEQTDLIWIATTDERRKIFTNYGIQEVLRILSMYLNRNLILSNYSDEQILVRVHDFGIEVSDLIYTKYEDIFYHKSFSEWKTVLGYAEEDQLTVPQILEIQELIKDEILERLKLFNIICLELIDSVEHAYNRALWGGERDSLREARSVSQTQPLFDNNSMTAMMTQPKKRGLFNFFSRE